MKSDFFALYDALAASVTGTEPVAAVHFGERWAMAETAEGLGLAMATPGESIPPRFPGGLAGLPVSEAARAVSGWNLTEASCALAAANAFLNGWRLWALRCPMKSTMPTGSICAAAPWV